jgi:GxxExxY protein
MEKEVGMELLLRDEVYAIIRCAMNVHTELGCGFLEAVYCEPFEMELLAASIPFERQKELLISYKGQALKKKYIADFICYGQIIVEVKATDSLSGKDEAQLLNYLKATGLRVGLLINFGSHGRLEWKRFIL